MGELEICAAMQQHRQRAAVRIVLHYGLAAFAYRAANTWNIGAFPDFDTFSTIFRKSLIINIVLRPPKFVVEKRYELTMLGGEKKGFC